MKSRERWAEEQEQILKIYDEVKQELLRIPGVVDVGVGVKETDGGLTEEAAFRVYVIDKLPESLLPPEQVIPKTIRGFPTDVIRKRDHLKLIGFNDEDDWKNYSTKVGGIRIGNDKETGTGTLGCFCRLTGDGSTVFLSNHHVLFDGFDQTSNTSAIGSKVGQPQYNKSCCCTCNEIGVVLDGEKDPLDCAIAKLNSDVPHFTKARKIKKTDGTTELTGVISGSANAVMSDEVWKVGARTGLTRGTLSQIVPDLEIQPKAPFTKIADHGDSGSVVVRFSDGKVVGLLKSINVDGGTFGYATPIQPVLTRLKISVIPTDESQDSGDVAESNEERLDIANQVTRDSAFADLAQRLQISEAGRFLLELIRIHRTECLNLVNHRRAVTVTWHRSQGPTFLAALARSAKEPFYLIPDNIEGISRKRAAADIGAVLTAHGSEALRADLREYSAVLIQAFAHCATVEDLIAAWEAARLPARIPLLEPVG